MQRKKLYPLIFIVLMMAISACGGLEKPTPYPANVDWETAVEILNTGEVDTVYQLHNLEVTFLMKDGSEVRTIEPRIDEIFHEVENCGAPCSKIALATE